jgi:CRP/FNR family transcriptional regulator
VSARPRLHPNGHQPSTSSGRPRRSRRSDSRPDTTWQEQLGTGIDQIHLAEGDFIFRDGKSPQIALLRAGVVRVFISTRPGRELTMDYARAGDLIGVAPYLAHTNEWNAEAVTDAEVSIFTLNDLLRAAALNPELPWRIAEDVATWTTQAMREVAHDAGHSTRTRVARHLRELSVRNADGRLVAHISQQHLAASVGTVREVVSRELNAMRAESVIETAAGSITVIDEVGLARIAAAGPGGRSS